MKMRPAILSAILSAMAAGCIGPAPKEPVHWLVETRAVAVKGSGAPRHGVVRMSRVSVRPPYDRSALAVLRKDGSVAFDPANSFAAPPASLLKWTAKDIVGSSGVFEAAVGQASAANARLSMEIDVPVFALDCRVPGLRNALATVKVTLYDGHEIAAVADGDGEAPAEDGDYSAAFSAAFSSALVQALKKL